MSALIGVDVGGTFTDVVLVRDGNVLLGKVPSTPQDQSEGFAEAVARIRERAGSPAVGLIAHGTTVATNAVLERRGARTGFIATDGFRDLLVIGRQQRPSLYDLRAVRPDPVVPRERSATVVERVAADGSVVTPLDERAAEESIERLVAGGVESLAVCLLFSFANPANERRLRELTPPGVRVSLSSDVLPEFREYERASTTALDAYIGPVVERYVANLRARVEEPVVVMRSGGGTMSASTAAREPVHTLLSGPAGGVRGATLVAREAGVTDLVTFDMGGTSTDVCLVEGGEPAVATEASIGGLPFRTPSLAVHTVGAGGGSLLWVDEAGALRAGPRSAGADPGPACYGRGGAEPAVTDAHVRLGHLDPDAFLGGRMRLDAGAARAALQRVGERIGASDRDIARAGLAAARSAMAAAIRVVTVQRGRDPRELALVAFGGAGPMHATALAGELGMRRILIPPAAGVLSAFGLLAAPLTSDASRTRPMIAPGDEQPADILFALEREAVAGLREQGTHPVEIRRMIDCRYAGQSHEVTIDADPFADLPDRFAARHHARFGWSAPGEDVELVTFRIRALGPPSDVALPRLARGNGARAVAQRAIDLGDGPAEAPAYARSSLGAGDRIEGPCVIDGEESTILIDAGWHGEVDGIGTLILGRA